MAWPSQVNFAEMHGYPQSRWQLGEFTATRKVICDWSDRVQLLLDIGGSWEGLSYPYPEGPVDGDGNSTAFAFSVTTAPLPAEQRQDDALTAIAQQSVAEYDKAVLTLLYSNRGIQWSNSRKLFITETLNPFTIHDTVPRDKLFWADGDQVDMLPGKIFYGLEYTLTLHFAVAVPASLLNLVGCCNSNTIQIGMGLAFAPQTLLFEPPAVKRSSGMGISEAWEIRFTYKYKPDGWNKFWRPETGQSEFTYLADGVTQYVQYPLAVFP